MKVVYTDASRLYIDPSNHDFARNYLCDFFVFSDFLKFQSLGISRAFSLVVHCSIFKILVSGFRAATFILYHIQKFLSSKHFVNRSSDRFLFFPSRRDQLFYLITFCRFCQVNNLWTDVQPTLHFSSSTACPKQSAYSFYHTFKLLSSELFLNKFHRPLSISRSALPLSFIHLSSWLPLPCDSFIIIPRYFDFVK